MRFDYILSLNDPQADLATVGGKGASLARMASAGLPVPDGFHVTTAAYEQFVADNGLQSRIDEVLGTVDTTEPDALERASRAITQMFAEGQIPPAVASEIVQAYAALPGQKPAVAVRSSATAEDLPEASFAGQQETYLNVSGASNVLDATKKCWASLWTARAIAYRARQGVLSEGVALAVVVQLLVPAEAAGILFTADPVSGRRDRIVVSAAWGLGEAIVGGRVTPDTLTLDKETGRVLSQDIADKQIMTVRMDGGIQEQTVPENLRRVPVLDDDVAPELARLGSRIEELYQIPMDIEWALADGKFAIVQARPITALPEPEAPVPTEWKRPNPKAMYARGSMAEHLPNPVAPLFGSMGIRLANQASADLIKLIVGNADIMYDYTVINGYTYFGTILRLREAWIFVKMSVRLLGWIFRTGTQRWREARTHFAEVIHEWEAKPVESLSPTELLTGAREAFLEAARLYTVIQAGILPTATSSELLFTRFYNSLIKRKGDPEATTFLFGFDTAPLSAEKSLFDLAAWCRARPVLAEYAKAAPAGRLADDLRGDRPPAGIAPEEWADWRARFQAHLQAHGRTAYDFDFTNPVPVDAPEPLLETIKMYLSGKGSDPHMRQGAAVERREQATQTVLARLRWPKKGWFQKLLRWAQTTGPVREDCIADMGMGHLLIRRLLGELGRRFAAGGAIAAADDVYWLYESEVEELITVLERGDALPDVSARIAPRQALWRAQRKAAPPAVLPEKSRWAKIMPWSEQRQGGDALRGTGASAGQVTAPACVLFGPEDFPRMKPGDVLVAVTTTPAWTPLFAMASAVVTDIGGPLSHSSIVAREYGIPAVMATGIGTRRIQNGQLITVDGSAGTVALVENPA